ncbi:histone-like nucleoid-structuring protein Lsr2 [Actinocorallia sp. B10E7]|uniref:Lsr2 dimerization domain-containing protein n=1 Tax=Actinocorallia sp. B10E7 TaxID=3153558 RepID=UPI00325C793D
MATKTIVVDDIDGYDGEDVARREFEVGGGKYAIDLGDANYKKLGELLAELAPFVERAAVVKQAGRTRKSSAETTPRLQGYTNTDVRAWAAEQGIEVGRSKIDDEVYERFVAAHPDARPDARPAG